MIFIDDMYRPLPKELTIKKSLIEGLGLFTNNNLSANTELGISHVEDIKFEDNYIPNCEFYIDDNYIRLRTIRHINEGNELTAEYWLYDMESND